MTDMDYTPTQGALPTEPSQPANGTDESVPEERRALVKKLLERVKRYEKKYEKRFKRMREDMKLTRKGATDDWNGNDGTKYVANLIQRHVKQRVSSLYAKNPTVKARRRQTMDFKIWDGNFDTAKAAMQMTGMAATGMPVQPGFEQQMAQAQALLADIAHGRERQKMIDGIGRTLEICYTYYMTEGQPPFKLRAKQLIRRTVTCGVGYVKLGYQREMGRTPDWNAKMEDDSQKLAHLQMLADKAAETGESFASDAELEELKLQLQQMQQQPEVILREGLIFDFPRSYDIIPIGDCVELKGFVGCYAVAQKMLFSVDKVKEIYGRDLKGKVTIYDRSGKPKTTGEDEEVCIYEYYDKPTGLMYTMADGYCDFVEEPALPPATVEQFFPYYVISFNDIEDEEDIFPPSDPELLRSQQMEYNRSREALRQHRIANQPNYAASAGAFPDWSDETKLLTAVPHEVIKLNALAPNQKVSDVLQPIQKVQIDPAVYDTNFVYEDILRTVGSQEANFGGEIKGTATGQSIAENSRVQAQSSEIDDVDDMLSQLARAGGQILLKEMSPETATKIAGIGAKWPQLSVLEIAEELYLDIEAGSSGKPNKSMELANWERLLPLMIQMPGISPTWMAKESIKRMDDHADMNEAMLDGAPSIMAINAMEKAASAAPEDQGVHGGDNQARAPGTAAGAQANYGPDGAQPQPAQAGAAAPMIGGNGPHPTQRPGQPAPMGGAPSPQMQGAPPQPLHPEGQIMQPQMGPDAGEFMPQPSPILDAGGQPMQAPVPQPDGTAVAVQAAGAEAVAAISKAASDAVTAIQNAAGNAVAQVSSTAAAVGVQGLMQQQSQPPAPSAIDQLLADRLMRLPPT